MRKIFLFGAALTAVLFSGCTAAPEPQLETARKMIESNQAECVLITADGRLVTGERGHGVSPLLALYESRQDDMAGATVVDKVVGRAAAAIAICGKVRHVHGEVMSEDAVKFLHAHNITTSGTLLVPRILNRKRNGLCPLEQSVAGIDDPAKALVSLKQRIATLRGDK